MAAWHGLTFRYKLWWVWRYLFTTKSWMASEAQRKVHFTRMTGLHHAYIARGPATDDEIIAMQMRKIRNLEQQRTAMTRGFTKKITKLQHQLRRAQTQQLAES